MHPWRRSVPAVGPAAIADREVPGLGLARGDEGVVGRHRTVLIFGQLLRPWTEWPALEHQDARPRPPLQQPMHEEQRTESGSNDHHGLLAVRWLQLGQDHSCTLP
jgi:hypothetical protein